MKRVNQLNCGLTEVFTTTNNTDAIEYEILITSVCGKKLKKMSPKVYSKIINLPLDEAIKYMKCVYNVANSDNTTAIIKLNEVDIIVRENKDSDILKEVKVRNKEGLRHTVLVYMDKFNNYKSVVC